jgi:DNA-binding NtrC family response regulator
MERTHIHSALTHFKWNRARTAKALGITPKTLYLKIKRYEIATPDGLKDSGDQG